MSVYDSIALMVMSMSGIFSSVQWLYLDTQSVMNKSGQACIGYLHFADWFVLVFFGACVIGLQHLFEDFYQQFVVCNYADLMSKAVVVKLLGNGVCIVFLFHVSVEGFHAC